MIAEHTQVHRGMCECLHCRVTRSVAYCVSAPPVRVCLMTDVYWMSQSATLQARQGILGNNELQLIITACALLGFVEVLEFVVNFCFK